MLTKKQLALFAVFLKQPFKERTFREIKAQEKSNAFTQQALKKFQAEELITKRKIGNMFLYAPNMNNSTTISYCEILAKEKLSRAAKQSLACVKAATTKFSSIILFGSYAEGTHTPTSDLDLAVIVASEQEKKSCESKLTAAELKSILTIDAHVFTEQEFKEMLADQRENLGKQVAAKHLPVFNATIFYAILQESIDHGLKIVYAESGE